MGGWEKIIIEILFPFETKQFDEEKYFWGVDFFVTWRGLLWLCIMLLWLYFILLWVYLNSVIIAQLVDLSCNLRDARFCYRLKIQDRAKNNTISWAQPFYNHLLRLLSMQKYIKINKVLEFCIIFCIFVFWSTLLVSLVLIFAY